MNSANLARFLSLGAIWGASYTLIKLSLAGLTPSQLVLGRLLLGALLLLVVARARTLRLPAFGPVWGHFVVSSALGMVAPFLLLAWGEQHTSAAMAGTIIAALPLVTMAFVSIILPTETINSRKLAGMVIGFAGTVLVISPWRADSGQLGAQLAVLAAATCYAAQTVYVRKFLSPLGLPPLVLAASQLLVALFEQLLITPFMPWQTPVWTPSVIVSTVVLGFLGTGIGYVLYFRLISELGATTASAVNYLVPVAALVISSVGLHDETTWNMWLGVGLVLVGLGVAEKRFGGAAPRPLAVKAGEQR
ncbi:DMT family transporter [Ideonella sp. YS5]|uniref:DMT family transporter n=1 Tax=Ideonella sp. YS5 TaxID=3453714 RepID=UPI003EE88270